MNREKYDTCSRNIKAEDLIIVYTPKEFVEAGKRLMAERYEEQKEQEKSNRREGFISKIKCYLLKNV